MNAPLKELEQIVNGQTTVRTSKLKPILQSLVQEITKADAKDADPASGRTTAQLLAELDRKEKVIVRLQEEAKQHTLVRQRHKVAMQDYENLKKRHNRTQTEYTNILKAREKDKGKLKGVQRELTDTQVKLAAAEKKVKRLEKQLGEGK